MSNWRNAYFCVECEGELSIAQVLHSNGCCPHCGYTNYYSPTVVPTVELAYRYLPRSKWWRLWEPRKREFKERP